jgi:hypothetical protein
LACPNPNTSAVTITPSVIQARRDGRPPTHSDSSASGTARNIASSHTPANSAVPMALTHGSGVAIWFGSSSDPVGTHQPSAVRVAR